MTCSYTTVFVSETFVQNLSNMDKNCSKMKRPNFWRVIHSMSDGIDTKSLQCVANVLCDNSEFDSLCMQHSC